MRFEPVVEVPHHCSPTGKLYMSRRSGGPRERIVRSLDLHRLTGKTIVASDILLEELCVTRRRGWSISDGEATEGVVECAVPILAPDGSMIAVLAVLAQAGSVHLDQLAGFLPEMRKAAARLALYLAEVDDTAKKLGGDRRGQRSGPPRR